MITWGFRTRLALIITGAIVVAGACLLAAQYLVVQALLASAMTATSISCAVDAAPAPGVNMPDQERTGCEVATSGGAGAAHAVLQQSIFVSDEVSRGLVVWSVVLLVAFAVVAAAIASWLARRSLDRIGEVTAATREITERDLDRRLELPGPNDEIKELGDTIDGMLDRLQLAFAAQDRFVANASHELRTPLTTTRTALEIPLRQGDVPDDLTPALQRALRATAQSERLIAALLSLAQGRADPRRMESLDLSALVREQIATTAPTAELKDPGSRTPVVADRPLLERAVHNLLDNAVRHNLPAEGKVWVRIAAGLVEVENTGRPLDPETVALLTEPFYRGDATRINGEGVGLGLAIVDSIATTHGGRLRLRPRPGGGLIARLELPTSEEAREP